MELEVKEIGKIKKEEPECTPIRSSSKQNYKMSIRLYQIIVRNYKHLNKVKNCVIGILLAVISKMAGLEVESDWLSVAIWIVGITSLITYFLNLIDRGVNYWIGGIYD